MLTQADLDAIHQQLTTNVIPLHRNEKGEPCYILQVVGTEEEIETIRQKLRELE